MQSLVYNVSSGKDIKNCSVFEMYVPQVGEFYLREFNLETDSHIIHDWVIREYAEYWQMMGMSFKEVKDKYRQIEASGYTCLYLGFFNEQPSFLLEVYKPEKDRIAEFYAVEKGDHGMHILVGPATRPIRNFTWHVFKLIMEFIFRNHNANRIVVEPDIRNQKIHILNKRAGFVYSKVIHLPEKKAHLAFCTKDQFMEALLNQES